MEGMPLNLTPMTKKIFADCHQYGKYITPNATPLFGHIINENYQAPADDNWIDQDQPDLPPQQEQPPQQAQSPDEDVEQERRTKRRHSSPPAPAPEDVNVPEPQEEAGDDEPDDDSDDSSDDDSNAPLDPATLARMQRIVSPRRFQRLQRASQRAFPTSQASSSHPAKRTRDADPIAVPDPQLRVCRQRVESTSQAPSSSQNPLSHLLSVVSSLKDQVQAMQTTIDSQQQQIKDQDLRISALESELQSLKTTSVVQGENSDNDDEEENDEDEEDNDDHDKDNDDDGDDDGNVNDDNPSGTQADQNIEQTDVSTQHEGQDQSVNLPTEAESSKQTEAEHDSHNYLNLINFDMIAEEENDEIDVEQEKLDEADTEVNEIVIEKDDRVTQNYFSEAGVILNDQMLNEGDQSVEDTDAEIPTEETSETPEMSTMKSEWFKKISQSPKLKTHYKVKDNCKGTIISWKYDEVFKMFAIKRTDGIQYFGKHFHDLSSLPKCEIGRLAQLNLINRSNNDWGNQIERILRKEVRHGFELLKPAVGRRMIYKNRINPTTNKPWIKLVYPPVRSLTKIPLTKYPLDFLKNFKWWWYNGVTGEAVIENQEEGEMVYVYDPINLVNFSESDLKILHRNKILFQDECREIAMTFQRVVDLCVKRGIHAGSQLPQSWK